MSSRKRTDLFDEAKKDICGKRALVGLIKNDHAISLQQRIAHGLPQQHSICEEPAWAQWHSSWPVAALVIKGPAPVNRHCQVLAAPAPRLKICICSIVLM